MIVHCFNSFFISLFSVLILFLWDDQSDDIPLVNHAIAKGNVAVVSTYVPRNC